MIFTRTIVDAYHGDDIDVQMLANNGVVALIHKASQGSTMQDDQCRSRGAKAKMLKMLFGMYHFGDDSDPIKQVDNFLKNSPAANDFIALDWETNGDHTMTYEQACAFVVEVKKRLNRYPTIYGSSLLKEKITEKDSVLHNCPLWLAQYASAPTLPDGWNDLVLWQYTGDGQGPLNPKWFPGANNNLDVNQFNGTVSQLRTSWPFS